MYRVGHASCVFVLIIYLSLVVGCFGLQYRDMSLDAGVQTMHPAGLGPVSSMLGGVILTGCSFTLQISHLFHSSFLCMVALDSVLTLMSFGVCAKLGGGLKATCQISKYPIPSSRSHEKYNTEASGESSGPI